jgi:hypothetical protein
VGKRIILHFFFVFCFFTWDGMASPFVVGWEA